MVFKNGRAWHRFVVLEESCSLYVYPMGRHKIQMFGRVGGRVFGLCAHIPHQGWFRRKLAVKLSFCGCYAFVLDSQWKIERING
jgi:hypothetical protein